MSWITIIWSMVASACLTLAVMHGLIWLLHRESRANLLFAVMAVATAGCAGLEMWLLRAETPAEYGRALWWVHLPFWLMIISLVGFVRIHFRSGRQWLTWTVVGLRSLALILNFFLVPNINYREITAVRQVAFLGETAAVADGVRNPWMLVGQLSSVLLIFFVADATLSVWRRGGRRQTLALGVVILFYVMAATFQPVLYFWGLIEAPFTTSVFCMGIIMAMGYELSRDVVRAAYLARDLQVNEAGLRESNEKLELSTKAANVGVWTRAVNEDTIWASERWLELFEFEPAEHVTYERFQNRIPKDERSSVGDALQAAFDGDGEFEIEHRILLKNGDFRWIGSQGKVEFDNGKPLLIRGASVDITARKLAEEKLKSALTEVEQLKEQLQQENIYLKSEIELENNFHEIIGQSDEIKYTLFKVEQVAPTDATVLILGETGTGKELVARAIHKASPRVERPMVRINCAALPANLIESELFGHERGAFTGANVPKAGRFELADHGTLFLDEIGELPLELQPKLLRVLQEGEFERLGSNKTIKVNVRIIAATNRDLNAEVQQGRFREDLWYRLNVFPITVPPLRQRRRDLPLLVRFLVEKYNQKLGKTVENISPAVMNALQGYSWPGNVRELANVIERAVISSNGPSLMLIDRFVDDKSSSFAVKTETRSLLEVERHHIIDVLESTSWKIEGPNGAARLLGLNASTLRSRMTKLNIQRPN